MNFWPPKLGSLNAKFWPYEVSYFKSNFKFIEVSMKFHEVSMILSYMKFHEKTDMKLRIPTLDTAYLGSAGVWVVIARKPMSHME